MYYEIVQLYDRKIGRYFIIRQVYKSYHVDSLQKFNRAEDAVSILHDLLQLKEAIRPQ